MIWEVIAGFFFILLCVVEVYSSIASDRAFAEELARLQKEIDRIRNGDKEERNE